MAPQLTELQTMTLLRMKKEECRGEMGDVREGEVPTSLTTEIITVSFNNGTYT